jgi:protein-S-isoprenylcysteine O-methyltransferase Ste14
MLPALFALSSAGILWLSWRSLRSPRSHGFYRFFAFEFIAAAILLNVPHWFDHPFSPRQLASWLLLTASAALAIEAFRLLRILGRPSRERSDPTRLGFENTSQLVIVGLYRRIRHPMYASLLALAWGATLKDPSLASLALGLAASLSLLATALAEERENLARFGAAYADYMKTTRRFFPFLF